MKDKIRYSEGFKLKVMEELRDAKWKSVKEARRAIEEAIRVYNTRWLHEKCGFQEPSANLEP